MSGVCRSVFLFFCLSVFLSFCLSVFLSFCLSVFLSFCLSVFLSFCLSAFLSFCLNSQVNKDPDPKPWVPAVELPVAWEVTLTFGKIQCFKNKKVFGYPSCALLHFSNEFENFKICRGCHPQYYPPPSQVPLPGTPVLGSPNIINNNKFL